MAHDATRAVRAALEASEHLSSLSIEVVLERDTLVLRGAVHSWRQKLAAHRLASELHGSQLVRNELEVVSPVNPDDLQVSEDVRALLAAHPRVDERAIVVSVTAGRVSLSGSVSSEHERLLAGDVALQAPGARVLKNQLVIARADKAEADVVSREIEHELAGDERLAGCELRFASSGALGVLSGTVDADEQRRVAVEIVRSGWAGELRNEVQVREGCDPLSG